MKMKKSKQLTIGEVYIKMLGIAIQAYIHDKPLSFDIRKIMKNLRKKNTKPDINMIN
jgi:hypothetical protein